MKRTSRSQLAMLAGWLFADLFLVLLIVGLSMLPAKGAGGGTSPPSTTTQQPGHPMGLDPHYLEFGIALSPTDFRAGARDALVQLVNAELEQRNPAHRLVGFVLAFASDNKANANRASATAQDAVNLLVGGSRGFASATGLGYWQGQGNNFDFKVFLLN